VSLDRIEIPERSLGRFAGLVGPARLARLAAAGRRIRRRMHGRTLWAVNSTSSGGGVAEMLDGLLPLARTLGADVRWAVIRGDAEFFAVTKRLCNGLYGSLGDGGELGPPQRAHYERVSHRAMAEFTEVSRAGDVVVVLDPQPAALVEPLRRAGRTVVWRCHIGVDAPTAASTRAWDFLRPYVHAADGYVFSTAKHVLPGLDPSRTWLVSPSIDPFAAKNIELSRATAAAVLRAAGLLAGAGAPAGVTLDLPGRPPVRIRRPATVVRAGAPFPADAPLVVQVSRWDRQKDMPGVLLGFARHVDRSLGARLLLAGPDVGGVADDPEAAELFGRCRTAWAQLPEPDRQRIQLACIPMADLDENAAIVNAIQRHAAVVTQKSLAEGFGLTVTEAMWKARPVVASAVGGILDQVRHGETGLLVADPTDLTTFGRHVSALLADPGQAARLGAAARDRVLADFLSDRHLLRWVEILDRLLT
jgi:trehalose synthase